MACCCGFDASVDRQFTRQRADKELARYRKGGPGVTTRLLRDGLVAAKLLNGTLLDVGTGIGALTFELLERGVTHAVGVDASRAYLASAEDEASRRGRSQATTFIHGDFVAVAAGVPDADLVTLDRVVCCYPSHQSLLAESLRHAGRGFALSYPRDRWFVKVVVRVENAARRLAGNPFRTFVHPVAEMQQVIGSAGFELVSRSQTRTWAADVYAKALPTERARVTAQGSDPLQTPRVLKFHE